jgi:hypothetical protein
MPLEKPPRPDTDEEPTEESITDPDPEQQDPESGPASEE